MTKQEKPKLSKQQKQLYVLGGLVGLLVLAVAFNFIGGSKPPAAPAPANGVHPEQAKPAAQGGATGGTQVATLPEFGPIEVLPPFVAAAGEDVHPTRNIFDYPPPPPPKIQPKPAIVTHPVPIPTINLGAVSPSQAIAGTSKPIPVTLSGSLFPTDAVVYINGQSVPSRRTSANVINATIPPSAIASPGSVKLDVKSASQPTALWSDTVNFQLLPSPDPGETFTYSGRVGAQAVLTFPKDATKRPKLVAVGETVNGVVPWRVLAINDKQVELLDTRNEIRKSLSIVAKSR
jgi:hypothetical protein